MLFIYACVKCRKMMNKEGTRLTHPWVASESLSCLDFQDQYVLSAAAPAKGEIMYISGNSNYSRTEGLVYASDKVIAAQKKIEDEKARKKRKKGAKRRNTKKKKGKGKKAGKEEK